MIHRQAVIHLVLGGARSGKSRFAEACAAQVHARAGRVVYLATAWAGDDEMRERISRHRADRPAGWSTVEVPVAPRALAEALRQHAGAGTCVLVDCLTLWLTQLCFPPPGLPPQDPKVAADALIDCLGELDGEVVLVSNEMGWGVTPLGRETREFVDEMGRLHQRLAACADRVTLVVAGLPLSLKPAFS